MTTNPIKKFVWAVVEINKGKVIALFDSRAKAELASKSLGRIFGTYGSSSDTDVMRMLNKWYK